MDDTDAVQKRLIVIRTISAMQELADYLADKDLIAIDTETTGLANDSTVIGYSFAAEVDLAYYVITNYWDKESQTLKELETRAASPALLERLHGKSLIAHNAVFDVIQIKNNFGVDLMQSIHTDTLILAHLLDENRHNGLKELALSIFGETADQEQREMKASVTANGGMLTKECYELYKGDSELIARYGAQDTILTLQLFFHLIPQLEAEDLWDFFYNDESMPQLRTITYDLNDTGLRVDPEKLQTLRRQLEADCLEAEAFIYKEIEPLVKHKYPGTTAKNRFNISAPQQLSWLMFEVLDHDFGRLTDGGRELCHALGLKLPYSLAAKREFIYTVKESKDRIYADAAYNPKTKKMGKPKKVRDYWKYLKCDKDVVAQYAPRYKWAAAFQKYAKDFKLLSTYVEGIQSRMKYNIIHPSFKQSGTTSGRYSSSNPNLQNLPREDKRVKACIVPRPGKVFVGADYSQLEPRVFASVSQDPELTSCFAKGEDFYSVVGAPIFSVQGCSLFKNDPDSFANVHKKLRDKAKIIALATPYGRTAAQQSASMGISIQESQELIDKYFAAYPLVEKMMLDSHEHAKTHGVVYSLYGRPRRMPQAKKIREMYGNAKHGDLPYEARNILNLAMNHPVQSSGASIVNRSAIAMHRRLQVEAPGAKIVLQVHDSLIVECDEAQGPSVAAIMQETMETTCVLPGVALQAEPKIDYDLARV